MTKVEGKWGIQFRSSFLDKASQTKEYYLVQLDNLSLNKLRLI